MKDDKTFNDADESTSRRRRDRVKRDEEYEDDVDAAEYEDDDEEYEYDEEESEDGDEGESYDEDDEDEDDGEYEEDEEDDDQDAEYDEDEYDDVFSLEEDLKREQRKQFIQYICIAVAAVAIIAFAIFASVKLTQKRVEDEKNAAIAQQQAAIAQQEAAKAITAGDVAAPLIINDWPTDEFPDVPKLEAEDYETTLRNGYARISVPSSATAGYDDYINTLSGDYGAVVYLKTSKLCVLRLADTEIHLCAGNQQNRVALCDEEEIRFDDVDYRAFDLPTGFKLVSANADSAMGRVLTYRLVSVDKALEYANSLVSQYGWKISGSFDMAGQTFYAVYTKNNLQMTLDYFSSSDDFTIKLDYVN